MGKTMQKFTKQELDKRQRAVKNSFAHQRIEGLEPTPEMYERAQRWVRGELTTQESIDEILARAKDEVSKRR